MKVILNWSKKWFNNKYEIFTRGKTVGNLIHKNFSNSAVGQLNNLELRFETRGFFNQKTQIIAIRSHGYISVI